MDTSYGGVEIDSTHIIDKEINGCSVRLHFTKTDNKRVEKIVLSNLIQVIDRKKQESSNNEDAHASVLTHASMKSSKSHFRHV